MSTPTSSTSNTPIAPITPIQAKAGLTKVSADSWGESSDEKDPEWMILYGEYRTGKTYKYLSLIETAHQINPETRAFIISTDQSARRSMQDFPYLEAMDCVKVRNCANIDEVMTATAQLIGSGFVNPLVDWIIVDLATTVWNQMPDYYCRMALKKPGGADQVELEWQQAGEKGSCMISFFKSGINPMWHTWETKLRTKTRANVIMVAGETQVTEEEIRGFKKADKNEVIKAYQRVGVYPAMQKGTPFQYHTIIHCTQPYTGQFYVSAVGEKGRNWLGKGEPNGRHLMGKDESFGDLYLRKIAGWE